MDFSVLAALLPALALFAVCVIQSKALANRDATIQRYRSACDEAARWTTVFNIEKFDTGWRVAQWINDVGEDKKPLSGSYLRDDLYAQEAAFLKSKQPGVIEHA